MKKILFSLTIVLMLLASCEKEVKDIKLKIDPNATILIRPAKGVSTRAMKHELTSLQIVERTLHMTFMTNWGRNIYNDHPMLLERRFDASKRDFNIPALKMFATDIIDTDGSFIKDFIYGRDYYFVDQDADTIAYIPQNVIENARVLLETAYNDENYTEVYRLFNEAFTFLPISE